MKQNLFINNIKQHLRTVLFFSIVLVLLMGVGCNRSAQVSPIGSMPDKTSSLCTAEPKYQLGGSIYPIAEKYTNLNYLGELFTADDCGGDRISQMSDVRNGKSYLGIQVWMKNNTSVDAVDTFKDAGFICSKPPGDIGVSCTEWLQADEVEISKLMKLKAFVNEFSRAYCVKCG